MKKRALRKDFYIEVKKTFGRFISILLIVALGVAFYAGVRASDPDMRISADKFYDDSNLMDIRVLSTLGLTEEDITAIAQVEGVESVMPSYSVDVLSDIVDAQIVVKLMSQPDSINKITITQGRMPEESDECLVDDYFLETTDYEIGNTVTYYSGTDTELEETLKETTYTIVGSGTSSYYLSPDRGTSSVGNGSVNSFAIIPKDTFTMNVYSEIYLTIDGGRALTSYTDEYDEAVDKIVENIEAIADARCEIRYHDIVTEANEKIVDAQKDIEEGEQKLIDAKAEIEDGKQKIADAKAELEEKEQELIDGEVTLIEQGSELEEGKAELADGWTQLNQKKTELSSGWQQLLDAQAATKQGNAAIAEARAQIEAAREQYNTGQIELENNRAILAGLQAIYDAGDISVAPQIEALQSGIAAGEAGLATAKAQIDAGDLELSQKQAELEAGNQKIGQTEAALIAAQSQIKEAENTLIGSQTDITEGEGAIAEAKQTIEDGKVQIEEAKAKIAISEQELADGEIEYEEAVAENQPKIDDGKAEIEQAKEDLADLDMPEWYVLDRGTIQTYLEYEENANRIGAIGTVFPAIFFLVAALISLTTMTRMVEEQRTQIGTLKALGYSKSDIAWKYIMYALIASVVGSLLGVLIGQKIFPYIIINAYKILYTNLPEILTPINLEYAITATVIAVLCTTVATVFACYKELMSVPSKLMRPAAPKNGKRVFLERVGFLWKRLNFSNKATIRNLIRYKKRFLMTVFGIGGCMALLLVGFGLKDSIAAIGDLEFSNVRIYDSAITIKDEAAKEERYELYEDIIADERVTEAMLFVQSNVEVTGNDVEKSAYLIIPEQVSELSSYLSLQDRKSGTQYELDDEGVVISEKLSTLLNVKVGDSISIKDGDSKKATVTVSNIAENYFYHYLYMTPVLYEKLYKEEVEYNEILTNNTSNDVSFEDKFSTDYMNHDTVSQVSFVSGAADSVKDMLGSMDIITYVLVASAALLAFVVLYNLNNINISERIRELATLKVLGFYDKEVSEYVMRENIWLTVIGAILGIFLGKVLHLFVIVTAETDITMFGRNIELRSYILSVLLTFVFSFLINIIMHFKLKKIDMVESMKSVE